MAVATLPMAPEEHEAEEIARKVKLVDHLLSELRDEGLPSRRLAVSFPGLQERFDPHELRLSAAGTCPRLRAARLAGLVPPEQPDEVDAGYFLRGRLAELVVRAAFARCYRRRYRRERAVAHPWGSGHADLWLPAERLLVEIKSASTDEQGTVPEGLPWPEHVAQAQAYLHFLRDGRGRRRTADAVLVYVFAGRELTWRIYPVRYRPAEGERIASELAAIARRAADGTALGMPVPAGYRRLAPPCVGYRSGGRIERCPLWEHCWGRPDAEDDGTVEAPAELAGLLLEYGLLHRQRQEAEREAKRAGELLQQKQEALALAFAGLGNPERIRSGPFTVARSERKGSVRLNMDALKAAVRCGLVPEEALESFTVSTPPSTRFLVREVNAEE